MLDSVVSNKIIMVSKAQYPLFHENISPEQLEERYGGTLSNPKIFWYFFFNEINLIILKIGHQ